MNISSQAFYIGAFAIWSIISYLVIYFLVRETTREIRDNSRAMMRMQMLEMRKKGFTDDQIISIYEDSDKKFFETLGKERHAVNN